MNTYDIIEGIINWYRDLPQDFTGINELLHQRQRLTGYVAEYATMLGLARAIWNQRQAQYEKKKMQIRTHYLHEGIGKANTVSRANSIKEYEAMREAEGDYYKLYYSYRSFNEILSAMTQQIAYLREEFKNYNHE